MTLYYSKFRIFKLEKLGGEFLVNTTKEFKVMLPLKYLFNFGFWNTFEIREIELNYYGQINLLFLPVQQEQISKQLMRNYMFQLLQQLKSSFKRKIVRNKHQNKINDNKFYHASKTNRLFDSSYQCANRFFILNLKKKTKKNVEHKKFYFIYLKLIYQTIMPWSLINTFMTGKLIRLQEHMQTLRKLLLAKDKVIQKNFVKLYTLLRAIHLWCRHGRELGRLEICHMNADPTVFKK